jgi:hypothetical protein
MPSLTGAHFTTEFVPTFEPSPQFSENDEDATYAVPTPPKKRKTATKRIKKEPRSNSSHDQSPVRSTKDLMSTFVEGLKYLTLEEAIENAKDRVDLSADIDDDLLDVERDAHRYVLDLVRAFTAPAVDEPTEHRLEEIALTSWRQYQATHVEKVLRYAATQDDLMEICAWKVYGVVIDIHQHGLPKLNNIPLDRKSKCSDRLKAITKSITDYAIVRYDVLRLVKLNELAASPYNYISRKITNWKNNEHKARRDQENADAAARCGTAYRKVLGDHSRTHGGTKKKITVKRTSPPVTPPRLIKLETSFSSQDEPHTPFAQSESFMHSNDQTYLRLANHYPPEASSGPSSATKRKLIDESAGELYFPSYFDPFSEFADIDPVLR